MKSHLPTNPAEPPRFWPMLHLLDDGHWHSGPLLAQTLGISRATISQWAQEMQSLGIAIETQRSQGYRLANPIEWFDQNALQKTLFDHGCHWHLTVHPLLDSTNSALLGAAQQGLRQNIDRHVYLAEWQTAGRGRLGRSWLSQLGGSLAFSAAWCFSGGANQLSGLSLAVGVAIAEALQSLGFHEVALKWPNDILWRNQKLGGILIEVTGDALGPSLAVIGIGINWRLAATPQRQAIDQPMTDLASIRAAQRGAPNAHATLPSRQHVLLTVLSHLEQILNEFSQHGFAPLRQRWEQHHAYAQQSVILQPAQGEALTGTVVGINDQGALLLACEGQTRPIWSGELRLRLSQPLAATQTEHLTKPAP